MKDYTMQAGRAAEMTKEHYENIVNRGLPKYLNKVYKKINKTSKKGYRSLYYCPFFGFKFKEEIIQDLRNNGYTVESCNYCESAITIIW
jgi:hypothetical protein